MVSKSIRDWLSHYKTLSDSQLPTFAESLKNNHELIESLYDLLEEEQLSEISDPIFHQLFDFYRSSNDNLRLFTLDLIPVLVWSYLSTVSRHGSKHCSGIESCLLGIYNLDAAESIGKISSKSFICPTLATPSIYHEPPSLASIVLSESVIFRYHNTESQRIIVGPNNQVERINAQNRCEVLAAIVNRYYSSVASVSSRSHRAACRISSRLVKSGFDSSADSDCASLNESMNSNSPRRGVQFSSEPRIVISAGLLLQLLNVVYFAMYNGHPKEAVQAVRDVQVRATFELFSDVLLVTNAILNSLQMAFAEQPQDGTMGLSSALSPHQLAANYAKSAITNESFRAKKLPDDIEVREEVAEPNDVIVETEEHADADRTRIGLPAKLLKLNPLKSALKKTDKPKASSKNTDANRSKEVRGKENPDGGVRSPRNSISMTSGLVSTSNDLPETSSADLPNSIDNEEMPQHEHEENIPLVTLTRPLEDNNTVNSHLLNSSEVVPDDEEITAN